jgi:hypothetical protein
VSLNLFDFCSFSATAACEGMKPYFEEIINHFRGYLVSATDKDTKKLQVAAIGMFGVVCF